MDQNQYRHVLLVILLLSHFIFVHRVNSSNIFIDYLYFNELYVFATLRQVALLARISNDLTIRISVILGYRIFFSFQSLQPNSHKHVKHYDTDTNCKLKCTIEYIV